MAKYSTFFAHMGDLAKEKNISLKEAAAILKEMGFKGYDCEYTYLKKNFDTVKNILDEFGFEISAIPCYFWFEKGVKEDFIDEVLECSEKIGCKTILAIPGEFEPEDPKKEEYLNLMCEGLNLLSKNAKKYGITITLEAYDFINSPCATPEGLTYFFEKCPDLFFTMDTGNFMYVDVDTIESVKLFKDKIRHVHLKDRSLTQNYSDEPVKLSIKGNKLYPSPVGAGVIPMKELVNLAKEVNYNGYYTAENSCPIHMEEFLTKSIKWMKENI
ncbi:MAG: sugar phosphate isomerase/epimerase [Ruminococcaceae bacterium]|nr:sugar phosphate isomerase/epimerase [Oscillospiraceae bacterium]